MPTFSQEKKPTEKIRLTADFSGDLLTAEVINSGNITVTITNALTDASGAALLLGSPTLSGNLVSQAVQGGTDGEVYTVNFSTGLTNLGLSYDTSMNLVITNQPASDTPLVTRDEVKRRLRIDDNSDDQLIDDLILNASSYIRTRTGRDFTFQTYTETLQPREGDDITRLKLYHYPVKQIDSVVIEDFEGNVVFTYTSADMEFVPEGFLWFGNFANVFYTFPTYKNIITYRAGFPRIPDDIKDACASLTVAFYRSIGHEGLNEERIGDYAWKGWQVQDFPGVLRREISDAKVEGVIARYRRIELDLQE